jgi:MFS family permease
MQRAPTHSHLAPGLPPPRIGADAPATSGQPRAACLAAWGLGLVFYFLQYAPRSAPGVMIPELTAAFNLTTLGISSLLGLYFYTYAGFAIVAGASLDRFGANYPIVIGVLATAAGGALFGLGSIGGAEGGRLLQGAGSAFAFTGAVYLATAAIPPYVGGLVFGIGSGAAMIPYAMIKEANPDQVKGSATGAMNFLVFSFSALFAPLFGLTLMRLSNGALLSLTNFREADIIWAAAIGVSLILATFLRETGSARRRSGVGPQSGEEARQ